MIIREAKKEEREKIVPLMVDFLNETNVKDDYTRSEFMKNLYGYRIFVAENSNGIAGALGCVTYANIAIAEFLYVKPEYRDSMIAGKLLRKAKEIGKQEGIDIIRIVTTPEQTDKYTKLGYKIIFNILEEVI